MKMEAEIGVVLLQATEHLEPPEAGRGKERIPPLRLRRKCGLAVTLILNF